MNDVKIRHKADGDSYLEGDTCWACGVVSATDHFEVHQRDCTHAGTFYEVKTLHGKVLQVYTEILKAEEGCKNFERRRKAVIPIDPALAELDRKFQESKIREAERMESIYAEQWVRLEKLGIDPPSDLQEWYNKKQKENEEK